MKILDDLLATLNTEEGFRTTEAEVRLAGYCPECQEHLAVSASRMDEYLGKEVR